MHCLPKRSNKSNFFSHSFAYERITHFYPIAGNFTLKAYIVLYALNAMNLKHKSYYIQIRSITYYMAWVKTTVVAKSNYFCNYLILNQLMHILFFFGLALSLERKLLSFNFET